MCARQFASGTNADRRPARMLQDHFGRAEGYNIVHADEQFFVPTDGKPLRGLIQVGVCHAMLGRVQQGAPCLRKSAWPGYLQPSALPCQFFCCRATLEVIKWILPLRRTTLLPGR
jgi:hypothetical protein